MVRFWRRNRRRPPVEPRRTVRRALGWRQYEVTWRDRAPPLLIEARRLELDDGAWVFYADLDARDAIAVAERVEVRSIAVEEA